MTEPIITINGRRLTDAQAAAVRVAITSFHADMATPMALGSDEHGIRMTEAYRDRLTEVLEIDRAARIPSTALQSAQERSFIAMRDQKVNRSLQLAGVVPEHASVAMRQEVEKMIDAGVAVDVAAAHLLQRPKS